ncbi:hypothetical protein [Effusibacillus consociatus]|uniref:Uncharacterized protein n=1 Tax=Effusibacillus consociatus TaxID=1117041 RepID=A0ABV9Q294_9BACL
MMKKALTTTLIIGGILAAGIQSSYAAPAGYGITRYETVVIIDSGAVLEYGQTEASGTDLSYVKTYTELYKGGVWQKSASSTGATYAYAENRAINVLGGVLYEGKSVHVAYGKDGTEDRRSSYASKYAY